MPADDLPKWFEKNWEIEQGTIMQIQFITWFILDPCDAPWFLYLELAQAPAGDLLLAMTTPSPSEIVEQWVDPTQRNRCSGRRRKPTKRPARTSTGAVSKARASRNAAGIARSLAKAPGAILRAPMAFPDTNTIIANQLPSRTSIFGPGMAAGERFFWPLFNQFEKVNLTMFVWDQIFTFLYRWMSALMKTEQCQASTVARCRMIGGTGTIFPQEAFITLPQTGTSLTFGNCQINIGGTEFFGAGFQIATGFTLINASDQVVKIKTRFRHSTLLGPVTVEERDVTLPPNTSESVVFRARIERPATAWVETNSQGDFASWQNHWINAVGLEEG